MVTSVTLDRERSQGMLPVGAPSLGGRTLKIQLSFAAKLVPLAQAAGVNAPVRVQ
jgi:hypothetical protein